MLIMEDRGNIHLEKSTKGKLEKFNKMRGKAVESGEFWDLVVITAVDEDQRSAYETQITEKLERKELPLGINYHVFADPPGVKIGNGGSTLYSLQCLNDKYGKTLSGFKIILIHAGGFSQRLPNASALGKIFTALPLGNPLYQMLELKLAMYVDFPSHMNPGILVTCADDIELYSIPDNENIVFDKSGFTALAHPSPISIGTTHGVFVLEPVKEPRICDMEFRTCSQFLHKPSSEKMRRSNALCLRNGKEFVYTDSTYYFDYSTAKTLLTLLSEIVPLTCEIDAYGDFLQALGPLATLDYTKNTANVTKKENGHVKVRQKIFHHLKGTELNVILLNNSKFYHVGTTEEYLYHFTTDPCLRAELGLLSTAFSICSSKSSEKPGACVMHCVLHPSVTVSPGSVVEYSRLDAEVKVGSRCIISGCWISSGLSVPSNTFMHSLSVNLDGKMGFVTVVFGVNDDLKKNVDSPAEMKALSLFKVSLEDCVGLWGLSPEKVRFSGERSACSLWNTCIFPVCLDLKDSFLMSLEMVKTVDGGSTFTLPHNATLTSLQEALQNKNLEGMLKFRKELFQDILKENDRSV
ncbi:fucose-1-phosphate guanylyltransferase isoform X1 [Triplophysa dalaica]|uniref:fucose-1-phosphate guanylyltransferase isoform X1 n=2 Tax=Triplophysa dalaica TaxID=1582913 RepID=UPI0024E01CED|nr:fucose-1-phosphate guanylyltransferase isoform X1 [Triplophysa dalaica]XP_056585752.1 fucose-1-phosphate guanylyltransferase isoform X1 [Triplophysa dalaica]XP_056585753.1 fucose-1-phosphate guanylyltransferase isoform X1 [Triplophysa dalaica]